jgi:hypothetical protein
MGEKEPASPATGGARTAEHLNDEPPSPPVGGSRTTEHLDHEAVSPASPVAAWASARHAAARPLPWRTLALFFVPFAALAAAVGLQRFIEGPAPAGDALLRWLSFASVAGLLVGAVTGLFLGRNRLERFGWTLWGGVGPWCATLVVTGGFLVEGNVLERWAAHEVASCRGSSRAICTVSEFRAACAQAASSVPSARNEALRSLGAPLRGNCEQGRCRSQWSYDGPWGAEESAARQVCFVVADAAGRSSRWMLFATEEY